MNLDCTFESPLVESQLVSIYFLLISIPFLFGRGFFGRKWLGALYVTNIIFLKQRLLIMSSSPSDSLNFYVHGYPCYFSVTPSQYDELVDRKGPLFHYYDEDNDEIAVSVVESAC